MSTFWRTFLPSVTIFPFVSPTTRVLRPNRFATTVRVYILEFVPPFWLASTPQHPEYPCTLSRSTLKVTRRRTCPDLFTPLPHGSSVSIITSSTQRRRLSPTLFTLLLEPLVSPNSLPFLSPTFFLARRTRCFFFPFDPLVQRNPRTPSKKGSPSGSVSNIFLFLLLTCNFSHWNCHPSFGLSLFVSTLNISESLYWRSVDWHFPLTTFMDVSFYTLHQHTAKRKSKKIPIVLNSYKRTITCLKPWLPF